MRASRARGSHSATRNVSMTRGRICPPHLLVLVVKSRSHHEGHEGSRSLGAWRSRLWFLLNAPSLSSLRRVHAEPTPPTPRRGRTASRAIICRGRCGTSRRRADSSRLTRPSTRPWVAFRHRMGGIAAEGGRSTHCGAFAARRLSVPPRRRPLPCSLQGAEEPLLYRR